MTNEQAKSELMQIYGMLSEEKKQALDVVMAQADGEYISKDAVIEWLKDIDMIKTSGQEKKAREQLAKLPSVAIPADKGLIRAIQSVIDSSDFPEDKVHRVELMIRGEIDG